MLFEVQLGSTWTTLPFGGAYSDPHTNVPTGNWPVRYTVTNNGSDDVYADVLFAGARNYNGDGYGVNKSDCPVYDAGTGIGYDSSTDRVYIPAGVTIVCTKVMEFNVGLRGTLYGTGVINLAGTFGWSFYNQALYYFGVANNMIPTAQVTNPAGTFVATTDPALQLFNAGEIPQVKFSFDNAGSSSDTTGITYSSTATASIASDCPTLATTFFANPPLGPNGSGLCTVDLLPASETPQTVTITASGTGPLGPVSQSITFTYAATPASCTTSAGTYKAGASVTVTCVGFEPGLTGNAVLHSAPVALGSFSTGTGSFSFTFTIPSTFDAGAHSVTINLGTFPLSITPSFLVTSALAATGVETGVPLGIAAVLLALGAAIVVYQRRRTRHQS